MRPYSPGDRGAGVADIQRRLARLGYRLDPPGADGVFGPMTEKAISKFQRSNELPASGQIDDRTWRRLVEATYDLGERLLYLRAPHFKGKDVEDLQFAMKTLGFNCGRVDGIFGVATEKAAREFQKNIGVDSDGIVGPSTMKGLENLRKILWDGRPKAFPRVRPKKSHPADVIRGKSILIAGLAAVEVSERQDHQRRVRSSGRDQKPGFERETVKDLCLRLGNLLDLLGADVSLLLSWPDQTSVTQPPWTTKVLGSEPEVAIALRLGCVDEQGSSGVRTLYSAVRGHKTKSRSAARHVHREAMGLLGLDDRGVGEETWALETNPKAPSIVFEPIVFSESNEARLLEDEGFRQRIAVAAFDGLRLYFEENSRKAAVKKSTHSPKATG